MLQCGWKHRASWTATELLVTFPPPAINAITLIPLNAEDTGGRFRVWLYLPGKAGNVADAKLLWDRKVEGGFPELKVLVSSALNPWRIGCMLTPRAIIIVETANPRSH